MAKKKIGMCEYCHRFPATRILSADSKALLLRANDDENTRKKIMSCVMNVCGSCVYVFDIGKMRRIIIKKAKNRR